MHDLKVLTTLEYGFRSSSQTILSTIRFLSKFSIYFDFLLRTSSCGNIAEPLPYIPYIYTIYRHEFHSLIIGHQQKLWNTKIGTVFNILSVYYTWMKSYRNIIDFTVELCAEALLSVHVRYNDVTVTHSIYVHDSREWTYSKFCRSVTIRFLA